MTDSSDINPLIEQVEKDLLDEIIKNLEQNIITDDQAKKQANDFLSLLPINDKKDLLDKLQKLSQVNKETKEIYHKYASSFEEEERQKKLQLMSEHIKNGQIDQALSVAKGGVNV
jgi:spore maturation protein CgeB